MTSMRVHQQYVKPWRVTLVEIAVCTMASGRRKRDGNLLFLMNTRFVSPIVIVSVVLISKNWLYFISRLGIGTPAPLLTYLVVCAQLIFKQINASPPFKRNLKAMA